MEERIITAVTVFLIILVVLVGVVFLKGWLANFVL